MRPDLCCDDILIGSAWSSLDTERGDEPEVRDGRIQEDIETERIGRSGWEDEVCK